MKKVIMIMCVVLTTLSVQAQKGFGLMGGVNVSTSSADYMDWRLGGFIGGLYDIQLKNNFYLQPRLVLSYQENQRTPEFYSQWNACLPVLASLRIKMSENTALRLSAGPFVQYAVFGREKPFLNDGALGWWHMDFCDKITYGGQVDVQFEYKKFFATLDCKHSFRRSKLNMDGYENTIQLGVGYKF